MRLAEGSKDLLGSTGEVRAPSLRVAVQIGGFLPLPVYGWLRRKSPDPYCPSLPLVLAEIVKAYLPVTSCSSMVLKDGQHHESLATEGLPSQVQLYDIASSCAIKLA